MGGPSPSRLIPIFIWRAYYLHYGRLPVSTAGRLSSLWIPGLVFHLPSISTVSESLRNNLPSHPPKIHWPDQIDPEYAWLLLDSCEPSVAKPRIKTDLLCRRTRVRIKHAICITLYQIMYVMRRQNNITGIHSIKSWSKPRLLNNRHQNALYLLK